MLPFEDSRTMIHARTLVRALIFAKIVDTDATLSTHCHPVSDNTDYIAGFIRQNNLTGVKRWLPTVTPSATRKAFYRSRRWKAVRNGLLTCKP